MAWDINETAVLGLTLTIAAMLTYTGNMDSKIMEAAVTLIIGYTTGRIFNHVQKKE